MKVIQTIRGNSSSGSTVDIPFYTGDDKVQAIAAAVQALATTGDEHFTVLSVHIDLSVPVPPWEQDPWANGEPPF
jgi:hypothetical protein